MPIPNDELQAKVGPVLHALTEYITETIASAMESGSAGKPVPPSFGDAAERLNTALRDLVEYIRVTR